MFLLDIPERVILLNIGRLYEPGMSGEILYDITRGVWKIAPKHGMDADFALSTADGTVLEVYAIDNWHPANTTPYRSGRCDQADPRFSGRFEFTGRVASTDIRERYLGGCVKHLVGGQNPVRYLNC